MVAELQTTDAAAIDWQSVGSTEAPLVPSPTLRLLARIPRVGDRSQSQPSGQVPPDKRTYAEQAGDFAEAKTLEADSPDGGAQGLAAGRTAPFGTSAGTRSRADLVSRLCEFHATIKPHAGVIVALALLASVGLLYWLVTGSAPNPREPQQQIGQDMLGQHSNEPDISLSVAPLWSAPGSRPVVTEDSVSELNASQRDLAGGSAEAVADNFTAEISVAPATVPTVEVVSTGIPRVKYVPTVSVPGQGNSAPQPSTVPSIQPYPKTHYGPFDFAQSDASGKDGSQSPMIARGPKTSRTGQLPR